MFLLIFVLHPIGCIWNSFQPPDWITSRPVETGYYFGVGTCGPTRTAERRRGLAIERAMWEICMQARGRCEFDFKLKEENSNGAITLDLMKGGTKVHTISGASIVDEVTRPVSLSSLKEETLYILIRIPAKSVFW